MHPDQRLDDLGWEIFYTAVLLDMQTSDAAKLAMDGTLRQRESVRRDLHQRLLRRLPQRSTPDAGTIEEQLDFWRQRQTPDGFVYFVQANDEDGAVKIGRATKPDKRVLQLQTGSPQELHLRHVVPGGAQLEAALHQRFAPARIRGEWFGAEYLPVILAYASGIAQKAIDADDGSGAAPHVTPLVARSQAEVLRMRATIERMWLANHDREEIRRCVGISDTEFDAHLAEMRASTFYDIKRSPVAWKPTRHEAMQRGAA